MRVFVRQNEGQCYVIPCKNAEASVAALKRQVIARCESVGDESDYKLVLDSTGALLSDKDAVQDVLKDGDFLTLRKLVTLLRHLVQLFDRSNWLRAQH